MNKSVRPKKYQIKMPCPEKWGTWPMYARVITDGETVNAASRGIRHTLDWSWIAFLIYAKAQGWELEKY